MGSNDVKAEAALAGRRKGPPLIDGIKAEVAALASTAPSGLITPADLLAWAKRNKKSATWAFLKEKVYEAPDAAEKLALLYCRRLIQRVRVRVLDVRQDPVVVRALVSNASDRRAGAGYRRLESVLADDLLRKEMVETALQEARSWALRARRFEELREIVEVIERVAASRAAPPKG